MAVTDGRRDSGFDGDVIEEGLHSRSFRIAAMIAACVMVLAFFLALMLIVRQQEQKLNALEAEKDRLSERLDEVSREKELLEGKLEYTKSLEGLLQYARDNLGYVFPDDTRIDDGTGGADGN